MDLDLETMMNNLLAQLESLGQIEELNFKDVTERVAGFAGVSARRLRPREKEMKKIVDTFMGGSSTISHSHRASQPQTMASEVETHVNGPQWIQ